MGRNRSAVRRRLALVVCTGLLVVVMAGCKIGTTTIPRDTGGAWVSCEEGTPAFVPGPGTTHVRFRVLRSNATVPLFGWLVVQYRRWDELLWDGTQSTGWHEFSWDEEPMRLFLFAQSLVNTTPASDTTWAITALDSTGKDVGITCAPAPPSS